MNKFSAVVITLNEGENIVRCLNCSLIYVSPRLRSPDRIYHVDAKVYFEEAKLIFSGKAKHHRDSNYLRDLELIK